jgi:phosphatidylglycerophosphate synthase
VFDERVRAILPRAVKPVTRLLVRAGVTPNLMSALAFALAIAAVVLVATGLSWPGICVWLVSRVGDGLDGILARETGRATAFGGYLDITLDMMAYSLMVIGFAVARPDLGMVWSVILLGYALVITTTLALSNAAAEAGRRVSDTNRTFQFTTGMAEAGETTVMYVLWVVLPGWLGGLTWLWVAMICVTVVQRTWLAYRVLR